MQIRILEYNNKSKSKVPQYIRKEFENTSSVILFSNNSFEDWKEYNIQYLEQDLILQKCVSNYKSILAKIFDYIPNQGTFPNPKLDIKKMKESLVLTFFFISIKFFSKYSICLFLPPKLCNLILSIAKNLCDFITINGDSNSSCLYTITQHFLESNIIYSSVNSEVYRYSLQQNNYAIKLQTKSMSDGSIYFVNSSATNQNIIQNNILGFNIFIDHPQSIICSEYITGIHIHGVLSTSDAESLIKTVLDASKIMSNIVYNGITFDTISQKLSISTNNSGNSQSYKLGLTIQNYWCSEMNYNYLCNQLCLYDLHRDNIIFEQGQWHIIDTDSVILGTHTFMYSCIIAASFLLEGYSPKDVIEKSMSLFPFDCERIIVEMIIRLYIGISFFSNNIISVYYNKYIDSLNRLTCFLLEERTPFSDSFNSFLHNIKVYL